MRCFCLERVLTLDGTLGPQDAYKRRVLFWVSLIVVICSGMGVMVYSGKAGGQGLLLGGFLLELSSLGFTLVYILCKKPLNDAVVVGAVYVSSISIFLFELSSRATSGSSWPLLVLKVDLLLVMQMPARYSIALVAFSLMWLIVVELESGLRFGLLDIPGTTPQNGEYGRRQFYDKLTQCEKLPCPLGVQVDTMGIAMLVTVVDFMATRGFARDVMKEQAKMARTISAVQEVASFLAGYDIEKVAELLEMHEAELPEEMAAALRKLEQNLRGYKPYLPQTCFAFNDDSETDDNKMAMSMSRALTMVTQSQTSGDSCSASDSPSNSQSLSTASATIGIGQGFCLSPTKATLFVVNIKGTLSLLEKEIPRFVDLFTCLLDNILQATEKRRGMVDVFIGDTIHGSFNTSKPCITHASSALHSITQLMRNKDLSARINVGIASGKILRGDMGCERIKRFNMIGELVRDVGGMERAGRVLGVSVVCNRMCFSEAQFEHQLRLLPCLVEVDAGCEALSVAELVFDRNLANTEEDCGGEWMYTVQKNNWEAYNNAVRQYQKGAASADAVTEAAAAPSCVHAPLLVGATEKCETLHLPRRVTADRGTANLTCFVVPFLTTGDVMMSSVSIREQPYLKDLETTE